MTKKDLITRISTETTIPYEDVQGVLQKSLDYIVEALAEGKHIEFRDFGVFDVRVRKPRVGRNPRRPEQTVQIPARKIVRFKPGKEMKKRVLAS